MIAEEHLHYLTTEIELLERQLEVLYKKRAGMVLKDSIGRPLYGWCRSCGRSTVDASMGEYVCTGCLRG